MQVSSNFYNYNFNINKENSEQNEVTAKFCDSQARNERIKAVAITVGAIVAGVALFAVAAVIANSLATLFFLSMIETAADIGSCYLGASICSWVLTYLPASIGVAFLGYDAVETVENHLEQAQLFEDQAYRARLQAKA